jgi:hypothetical protein
MFIRFSFSAVPGKIDRNQGRSGERFHVTSKTLLDTRGSIKWDSVAACITSIGVILSWSKAMMLVHPIRAVDNPIRTNVRWGSRVSAVNENMRRLLRLKVVMFSIIGMSITRGGKGIHVLHRLVAAGPGL